MVFVGEVGWWHIELLTICFVMVAGGILSFRFVHDRRRRTRLPVRFLALVVAGCGTLGLLVFLFFSALPNPNTYSVPVYSPSRKMAARIRDYNLSGFGGADSSVELFTARGFKSQVVFLGEFKSVDDARWLDDHRLLIRYHKHPGDRQHKCIPRVFAVDVACECSEVRQFSPALGP